MSTFEPSRQRLSRRPNRRTGLFRRAALVLALVLAFLLGMAFARTLDERPTDGGATTNVRTLTPLPQQPPTRTVTVTVTAPP